MPTPDLAAVIATATPGGSGSMLVLQSAGDSASTPEFVLSLALLVLLGAVVFAGYGKLKYDMPEEFAETKSEALGQWLEATPISVFVREGDAERDVEERTLGALVAAESDESAGRGYEGTPPLRVALGDAWRDVRSHADARLGGLPRAVPTLGALAVLVAVLGSIAVSTDWVTATIAGSGDTPSFFEAIGILGSLTRNVASAFFAGLGYFPYIGAILSLGFIVVVLVGGALYSNWWFVSILLAFAAVSIWQLDKRVPDDVDVRLYQRRSFVRMEFIYLGVFVSIWLAGVLPAAIGALAGYPWLGTHLGVLCVLLVTGYYTWIAIPGLRKRIRHATTINWTDGPDRMLAAYLVARYVGIGLAGLAVPLVGLYAVMLVVDGRLAEVLAAFTAAPLPAQIALGLAGVGGLGIGVYELAQKWPDLVAAFQKALASQGTRLLVFQKTLTSVAVVAGATLSWAFLGPLAMLPGGVIAGALVYTIYKIGLMTRRNVDIRELFRPPTRRSTLVRCAQLAVDDTEEYVAFVGDTPLVNRDAEELAEDVSIYATHAVDPDDEPPELESHRYGEYLFKYGLGTPEDRREKLTEEVRKGVITPIREDHGIDEDGLEDLREEHPDEEVDDWFQQFLEWELLYPRGDWYEYQPKNDPWVRREAL